jgi:hypothetical protein
LASAGSPLGTELPTSRKIPHYPLPIVRTNSAIVAIRGRIGDVVFKTCRGRIFTTRRPCFAAIPATPPQRAARERMSQAIAYAQHVYADPAAKAYYIATAKGLGRQPFRLAVSDYLCGRHYVSSTRLQPGRSSETSGTATVLGRITTSVASRNADKRSDLRSSSRARVPGRGSSPQPGQLGVPPQLKSLSNASRTSNVGSRQALGFVSQARGDRVAVHGVRNPRGPPRRRSRDHFTTRVGPIFTS